MTPLIVDLDGTLLATDSTWELIIGFIKQNPLRMFLMFAWVLSGKAQFKDKLAARAALEVESLPYHAEFIEWLRMEKRSGRRIFLATGADARVAAAVANHLGLFDGVIASDGKTNAIGNNKCDLIAATLGEQNYEYAGNAMVDLQVWRRCLSAIVVAPNRGVMPALKRQKIAIVKHFPAPTAGFKTWAKALRVYQWVKNVLVFTPLVTSHQILNMAGLLDSALGFVIFSLVASSTYLVNDLLDLPADRRHATKCKRPLACGLISIPAAVAVAFCLLGGAALLSLLLPWQAALLVFSYSAASLFYSTFLKTMLMADVVALALFYTARLMYGGLVTRIEISIWTLAFCAFSFFSLAAAKRINDLAKANLRPSEFLRHRAYQAQDLNALVALAASTSNIAVLVLILYINSQQGERLYRHPQFLWTMCVPLLYWFSRILMLANRGKLADDPILFAAKDRATYFVLALMAATALVAT